MMKRLLCALATTLLLSQPALADFATAEAQYRAGDHPQSFAAFSQLARLGHVGAQLRLARSHAMGHGVKQNLEKAYAWALMAQDNGSSQGKALYLEYRKQVKSRRQAKALYKKLKAQFGRAALEQQLMPIARDLKAPLLAKPEGVHTPEPEYVDNWTQVPSPAWAIAQFDINPWGGTENVRFVSHYGKADIRQVVSDTLKQWQFEPSVNQNNRGTTRYGHTHQFTFGMQTELEDYAQSQQHQQLAEQARNGDSEAQYQYAQLIELNLLPNSKLSSLDWIRKAAVNGHPDAQFALYQCLEGGTRCRKDSTKSAKWLQLAEQSGAAAALMLKAERQLSNAPDASLAILEQLATRNYLPALVEYARLLLHIDPDQAIKYARQAMALDNNNPNLLATLGQAHYARKETKKGEILLLEAVTEAEYRRWPIDYYVNLLERLQRQALQGTQ